jgi:hypothetical protein
MPAAQHLDPEVANVLRLRLGDFRVTHQGTGWPARSPIHALTGGNKTSVTPNSAIAWGASPIRKKEIVARPKSTANNQLEISST